MSISFDKLILGSWMQIDIKGSEVGVGIEKFFENATKETIVSVSDIDSSEVVQAKSTWSINKSILTETLIDVSKPFSKKHGVKAGKILRAYINHLDEETLIITPLGKTQIQKTIIRFKRYLEQ